jgi:hypothetical protein
MKLIPRYLVNNRTMLVCNEAGLTTEYVKVYQRDLPVYKGISNTLEFQLKNADHKPMNLAGKTMKFNAYDENNRLVIQHDGVVLVANKGLFKIVITENDTLNLKQQYLKYNIYSVDTNNDTQLTYADEQSNASGTIYLSADAFPAPTATYSITTFSEAASEGVWYSESLTAEPAINGNEALHTAVVYTDSYVGDVVVQATLENQVTGTTEWADIATLNFTLSSIEPTPVNFNGVFTHLRFQTSADPADTITKILVRN